MHKQTGSGPSWRPGGAVCSVPFPVADWRRDYVARVTWWAARLSRGSKGVGAGKMVGAVFAGRFIEVLRVTDGEVLRERWKPAGWSPRYTQLVVVGKRGREDLEVSFKGDLIKDVGEGKEVAECLAARKRVIELLSQAPTFR